MAQFPANIDLSSLNGLNGFKLSGVAAGDLSGISVASAGDVNGDGFADLIVGAKLADANGNASGASYVVFGKASGFASSIELSALNGANGFQLVGASAGDFSGSAVASAGDVNHDGFADIIIGAEFADPNAISTGASYVVFGHGGSFAPSINLSTLNGGNGFRISGVALGDEAGISVASAGDVNGDGFADVIVGAVFADPHGNFSGASYVVFGHAGGFAANTDLATLNGSNGFKLSGAVAGDYSGRSVSSAGDINGDGFGDLIIGADGADLNGNLSGASYIVFGKSNGFAANVDLSTLSGSDGFVIKGETAGDHNGYSVSSAGDVNGDGIADLIIGAFQASPNGVQSGAGYVVFGHTGGFAANLDLATLNGSNGFQINGVTTKDYSGVSVATAGDVNGDGFSDVIIGAFGADPHGNFSGASYVVFGKAGGFGANLDLASLDGGNGFKISGVAAGDLSGRSVASAGDVNDDGFSDVIIGAANARPNGGASGASYVIFGAKPTTAVTHIGTAASQTLAGGDFGDTLKGLGGNDRLYGNGGKDKIDGGTGNDYERGGLGKDTMTGGAGNDVFDFNAMKESGKTAATRDVVTDFKHKTDHIDLKDIDANSKKLGDQAFKFIGQADFHHKAGELHYLKIDADGTKFDKTIVSGDINGDGKADFSIELSHLVTLTKVDFVL